MSNELYHYGVKGMKWGVRRAKVKEAKATYKKATNKAFSEYERTIERIEKPYKRGQNLSDKDVARENAAEKKYLDASTKAKAEYKKSVEAIKNSTNRALKKLEKQKVNDLKKKYGQLEDMRTYGKNADAKKNALIDKEMAAIEEELRRKR